MTHGERRSTATSLRRTLGIGGLFSIGYADVGAGIYLALSLVTAHAGYATPLAIGIAAIAYFLTGLTYAELSSTYPTAGGSATFAREAFGDTVSFLSGWMLCLDYLVTAAIFAIPAIGYLSFFIPILKEPIWLGLGAVILLTALVLLNMVGIRESVNFTFILSLLSVISEIVLVILGIVLVIIPNGLVLQWPNKFSLGSNPSWSEFVQAVTLAMVSYLGIEALAQASEETRIAGRTIPRAIILTLVTVIVLYMFISFVGVNVIPPVLLSTTWQNDPLTGVANNIPGIGSIGAAWIAILGCSISVIGANAGLIGSSRTLYALSKYQLLPSKFAKTHAKYRTPHLAILVFGTSSIILVGVAAFDFFNGGEGPLTLLGSLYNVGALVAYVSAHASLIVTRNRDKLRFRPFRVPFSIRFGQGDRQRELPILPLLGLIGTGAIWIAVIATHALGRILGLVWVIVGLSIYAYYRKSRNLPVWKNMRQDYD